MDDIKELTLSELADLLDGLDRSGAESDEPEGARYVTVSDTLLSQIAESLREIERSSENARWEME